VLFIYITRLASNEIFSPSNKIDREVGRTKDLSAPLYKRMTPILKGMTPYSFTFATFGNPINSKGKDKGDPPEQATKAQRGSRGIAPLFL
jgi:hypothetical protein